MTKPTTIEEVLQRLVIECIEKSAEEAGLTVENDTGIKSMTYSDALATIEQLVLGAVPDTQYVPGSPLEGKLAPRSKTSVDIENHIRAEVRQALKQLMGGKE